MRVVNGPKKPKCHQGGSRLLFAFLIIGVLFTGWTQTLAGGGPNVTGAKLYIQQNDLEQALRVLRKEIDQVNENNEDAWYLLGYIYARQKKYDAMMEAFEKAVALKPKFKEKGVKVGKDTGSQFHAKHGVDAIYKVVWQNSFNTGVKYFNEAINAPDAESKQASFAKAVDGFAASAKIQPDSSLSYRNWAAALLNAGRTEESVVPLKMSLEKNPSDVETKTLLAQVYMSSSKDSLAMPILEELWNDGVQTEEVADYLSRMYVRTNQVDKAKDIYKKAIAASPNSFHFRYNYGTILLEAQQFDEAIEHLNKAYEIDPESSDINYNLGAAYLNRGVNKREALPDDSADQGYLEDFKSAFPFLEKSIKMNPDDENSWFTLGRIAGQLNKIALAGYAFSKGEPKKSVLDEKVIVGMPSETLNAVLGTPDEVKEIESEEFNVEEWGYNERKGSNSKVGIPAPLKVYVADGRVDALMLEE